MMLEKRTRTSALFFVLVLSLLAGCSSSSSYSSSITAPLSADNLNLIFVVSPDLAYQGPGDINPDTANLTNQGLQRSLLMATYLKQQVLGGNNVTGIYALEPMTHLQTDYDYPDMVAYGYIQQFALLNQTTQHSIPAYSFPIKMSYTGAGQGLDFNNTGNDNVTIVADIIQTDTPGFYVFSAPWETVRTLMAGINSSQGYDLNLPASYRGPNYVYAISITPSRQVSLVTYNSNLDPASTYPELPSPVASAACGQQTQFSITRTEGVDGAGVPSGMNTNETVYLIRHAEAHPINGWENGNYVGPGQWRALYLPTALSGKINSPDQVYSIDPSLPIPSDTINYSYVRPSLTALPYAIANNLPFNLALIPDFYQLSSLESTSNFFFTGGTFSNQTILVAWEHDHIPPTINYLLSTYGGTGPTIDPGIWLSTDYDTIWTVRLDGQGNLTVDNSLCEGIDSILLPPAPPQF